MARCPECTKYMGRIGGLQRTINSMKKDAQKVITLVRDQKTLERGIELLEKIAKTGEARGCVLYESRRKTG